MDEQKPAKLQCLHSSKRNLLFSYTAHLCPKSSNTPNKIHSFLLFAAIHY